MWTTLEARPAPPTREHCIRTPASERWHPSTGVVDMRHRSRIRPPYGTGRGDRGSNRVLATPYTPREAQRLRHAEVGTIGPEIVDLRPCGQRLARAAVPGIASPGIGVIPSRNPPDFPALTPGPGPDNRREQNAQAVDKAVDEELTSPPYDVAADQTASRAVEGATRWTRITKTRQPGRTGRAVVLVRVARRRGNCTRSGLGWSPNFPGTSAGSWPGVGLWRWSTAR